MAVTKTRNLKVYVSDPQGNQKTINLNYANPNATDTNIDTAVKNIIAITNNTYLDTAVTDTYSLNEAI